MNNVEIKTIICVRCPQGCMLEVENRGKNDISIKGNKCLKGIEYGKQEIVLPMRMLTTTVQTSFVDFPRVSVKTSREIPLVDIFKYMKQINQIILKKRVVPGYLVLKNILNSGVDIVATQDSRK